MQLVFCVPKLVGPSFQWRTTEALDPVRDPVPEPREARALGRSADNVGDAASRAEFSSMRSAISAIITHLSALRNVVEKLLEEAISMKASSTQASAAVSPDHETVSMPP